MKLIRHHPFLLLALLTLIIGGAWHSAIVPGTWRAPLTPVVTFIGWPFIAAMRFASRHGADLPAPRWIGFLLGLSPYIVAECLWFLWRRRRRRAQRPAAQ